MAPCRSSAGCALTYLRPLTMSACSVVRSRIAKTRVERTGKPLRAEHGLKGDHIRAQR